MKKLILAALLATGMAGAAHADDALKAAIASKERTPANVARDGARHPYETLGFFGIKPTMTVVELSPGGGWYTEILAPYLREKGKLIAAGESPKSTSEGARRYADNLTKKIDANPAMFGKVQRGVFEPPREYNYAAPGSVDMVVTFRNIHNWTGLGDDKVREIFKSVHTALKPGGVFGVVDHRMPADKPVVADSGYLHEAAVIKMIEAAGFKLAAKSEVNANPKDKADHNKGVWSLPPVLANKDVDREKYIAIGESDRMTLKFIKQ
ncbi:class I SAM-dependent methyltransferase [Massilia sp. CF038]|uniref:class I SAM-dependent methyltransferase n=1 Tax=Massilia sp. CF038 TaxID=1881045 RepID=UPI000922FDF8|nr:class I SAM-dependent methyltransferase [Massilia sp. CF038]SHH69609.1 Predicted methyltransferase [Massilia sp. CF038]